MLLTIRAQLEAARALAYWIGMELDIAARIPTPRGARRPRTSSRC
jgi:hypothetical protein